VGGSRGLSARLLLVLLLTVACVGYVVNLGSASIWDANEAYYVETPREMIERGDYVTPTFNYEPRVNKPVLSYWVVALLYQLFGVSVGVQRLAIAAAALVMIGAMFLLARAASPAPLAPLLAAVGLAANPRFFMFARRILIDMGLTMCMTLTLTCFAMAEFDPVRRRRWLLAMYVTVGLGVLTKGPVAAVLPALIFIVYFALHRELGRIRTLMLPAGSVIVAAIVAPWYIALYMQSGWANILSFFVGENFERYTSLVGPTSRAVWFYLPVVLTDGLPWSLCLPGAVALWWRERNSSRLTPQGRIRTLLLVWIAVFVGFFSLSQTKQDLYIFPIVGAVTVLAADFIARALTAEQRNRWFLGAFWAVAGVLMLAGAGVLWLFVQAAAAYEVSGARPAGLLFVLGGAAIATLLLMRRHAAAVLATLAVTVAFCWTLSLRVLPDFERYKPVVPLSQAFLERVRPGDVLVHYDVALPSMVFYTRRHIDTLFHPEPFKETMRSGRVVFAVLPESRYLELQPEMGVATCVLGRQPTSDVKLREILAGQPPPAVLLISTRCDQ